MCPTQLPLVLRLPRPLAHVAITIAALTPSALWVQVVQLHYTRHFPAPQAPNGPSTPRAPLQYQVTRRHAVRHALPSGAHRQSDAPHCVTTTRKDASFHTIPWD